MIVCTRHCGSTFNRIHTVPFFIEHIASGKFAQLKSNYSRIECEIQFATEVPIWDGLGGTKLV